MHTVISNQSAGTGVRLLTLDGPASGHSTPGQFVTATVGDLKAAFFALANAPGDAIQLLIKVQPGSTGAVIAALDPGEQLTVNPAMGGGFGLDNVAGRELVVLINGSGISAVRALIHAEVAAGLPRPVHVYYGVLSPDHRSFDADLVAWARAGVQVSTVVDESHAASWTGKTGWVQDAAAADGLCRADVGLVLVGYRGMCDAARAMWTAAGCPEDAIRLNF